MQNSNWRSHQFIVSLCRHNGFTPSQPLVCILGSFWHRSHTNPRSLLCSETFQSIVRMLLSASHGCKHLRKLTAVGDDDLGLGGTGGGTVGLDLLDDVHAVDDRAEDNVLAVQPRGLLSADEELGAVARSC